MSTATTRVLGGKTKPSSKLEPRRNTQSLLSTTSHPQNSPKKKQNSALRSLKDSFKFKGSTNHKKNLSVDAAPSAQPIGSSKVRNGTNSVKFSVRSPQRLSAQRVSLFKYEKVKAMSCSIDLSPRRGSESSTSITTTRSCETSSDISITSRSSVKLKPSTLISSGTLEIYQISTPNLDPQEKTQEMNYLSLGRKDNIVHPILPRLQVSKLENSGQKFLISFFNPERYWEIEFLPCNDPSSTNDAIKEFESVISKICKYTTKQNEKLASSSIEPTKQVKESRSDLNGIENPLNISTFIKGKPIDNECKEEEEDDLNYLLVEDLQYSRDLKKEAIIRNLTGNDGENCINEAFKRAIRHVKPEFPQRGYNHQIFPNSNRSLRRYSSFQPLDYSMVDQTAKYSKRFSSVPVEMNENISINNE